MNLAVFFLGLGKLVFALGVAAVGIIFAARVLKRFLDIRPDEAVKGGNVAVGVVKAASLIALALWVRTALGATFDALDLTLASHETHLGKWAALAGYALAHLGVTLFVGTALLIIAISVFNRITPGVDEVAEVRGGNVSAAIVLSAVVVVVAILTAPALQSALNGLIPFPVIPERFPS